MTAPAQFGHNPIQRTLVLSVGADFIQVLAPGHGAVFPDGTRVWATVLATSGAVLATWEAVVTFTAATFTVGSELADTIPDGAHYRMYVAYPTTPTTEYLWFYGPVRRKQ
ncbi:MULTISPECIES: hypothetical protein [unclassified Nocardia]|uniref:LtfC-like domain-containing protein n=1 Tax=unclassified Nocardia TaxID=2637762 RepID=UPI00278C01A8|nr:MULTISPECIES: hypothetical protein [unclassified Nocardia]